MKEIERGWVDIEAQSIAFARNGSRPSIALLHGIPTHMHLWRNVVDALGNAGLNWVTLDLLGYGKSSKPDHVDLGIAAQARVVHLALDQLGFAQGAVVGHDIGGGVAQLLALNEPRSVRQLVLVDSVAYDSFPEPGIARLKEPIWDEILGAEDFDLRKGLSKGLKHGVVNTEKITGELVDAYEFPFSGVDGRKAYLRAARSLRSDDLTARTTEIEHLQIPTLLVWGAQDTFQPLHYAERLAAAMPDATLTVVAGAGHFLPEDAPGSLASLILDFVKA